MYNEERLIELSMVSLEFLSLELPGITKALYVVPKYGESHVSRHS